ncbi:hypothetical protein Cadr_000011816 [Camelus dromedarius]|uniref:Uncharacterized protein n=1 Tax=Camelus dromedarius TaxID=9838 RepID=A0A5N4DTB2_CAMDR|nr:hypothetical protein Cadr_000011816 [Camelus dromedarius]
MDQSGTSLGLSWGQSCGCSHLVVPLGLVGPGWPQSRGYLSPICLVWASSPDRVRAARGHEWKLQGLLRPRLQDSYDVTSSKFCRSKQIAQPPRICRVRVPP